MATRAQERDRARRRYEKQQRALAQREADQSRLTRLLAVIGTVVVVLALAAIVGSKLASTNPVASEDLAQPTASAPAALVADGCTQPPAPLGTGAELELPDAASAKGKKFTGTLTTNCGDIVIALDGGKAPQAVAAFLELAKTDYWVNSPCHRLTSSDSLKVLQCGDPTGTGQGNPGFGFGVENAPANGVYKRGVVAMARTNDPEKGNGGQFFIVWGDSQLPAPGYTIFGTVTSGLDIVDKIAALGVADGSASPSDGAPKASISILRAAATEKKA